ncbi:MAG: site-2 protease family protein [Bryobacteraceae bacterium]
MKWSIRLGSVAGIDVYVHATFTLLMAWVVLSQWVAGQSITGTLTALAFVLSLFACVVLHEFGHALTAKKYGIRTRDITLLPIGGVARLERMPEDPIQELWVALAGPAVNVVIAALLFAGLSLSGRLEPISEGALGEGSLLNRLMVVNVVLALFNMLPAFPMDGGRVLRALLATRMDYSRATQTAASIGQGMALLFAFVGFFFNPFLIFIALFVWIGAGQEAAMVQMKSALGGIPLRQAMITDFRILAPEDSLDHAVELILAGSQHDFPVVSGDEVRGILTRKDLLAALAKRQPALVGEIMQQDFQSAAPEEMLETAFRRLQECGCNTIPVLSGGRLVGMVTSENVGEFLMIQAARSSKRLSA